ncbi:MAG: hypothetical protein ACI8VC_002494 [Candidatus Endobugula sp.]|jgi:hypothetical protein
MQLAKSTNIIGGFILLACGVVGCFYPDAVASYYGFVYEQLEAKTTIRVLAGLCMGVGGLLMYFAYRCVDQRPILFSLWVILLSFALPRFLGLLIDGFSQSLMLYELTFEVVAIIVVACIYTIYKKSLQNE